MFKNKNFSEDSIYKSSSAVYFREVGANRYAVWNRYRPSIMFLNHDGIELLKYMRSNKEPYKKFTGFKRTLRKFIANEVLCEKQGDNFKENFIKSGEKMLKKIEKEMETHRKERLPYAELSIYNRACNLSCPYCIVNYIYNKNHKPVKKSKKEKIDRLLNVVDQFMAPETHGRVKQRIHFNGGEILLEFDTVEAVVKHVKEKYPRKKIEFAINTNATLVDDRVAQLLSDKNFNFVAISIDGYLENNNKTRRYHDGSETFSDIINGLNLLNKYREKPIDFFQGTILPDKQFDARKIEEMKKYGLHQARMGIDLVGMPPEQAKGMADLHFKMVIDSFNQDVQVSDDYIKLFLSTIESKKKYKDFSFYCAGFSQLAGKVFQYNIETEMVGNLCLFATNIQVALDEIKDDIYHPLLSKKVFNYLNERFEVFKEVCIDCEMAGICRGGCILSGIDPFNKKNEAACIFRKETWNHFLAHINSEKMKRDN
jgi:radical SAM protein with 4Fe4S-binding SPASM domain